MTPDLPEPGPTPDPVAEEITDEMSKDTLTGALNRRKGKKQSFLTRDNQAKQRINNSLLGKQSQGL